MAKRGQRKTSLGNALDSDNKITAGRDQSGASGRWRSTSDATLQQSRQKLFGSLREAMEHETAKDKECEDVDVASAVAFLDARTLSTLEKTQADEAGYTVIRRRALSDVSDLQMQQPRGERRSVQGHEGGQRGKQSSRGKRSEGHSGGTRAKPNNTSASSKPKRTPQPPQQRQSKPASTTREPWKMAVVGHSSAVAARPADCSSDAQRWLDAASSGAVLPAAPLPPPSPQASAAGGLRVSEWDTSTPAPMWPSEMPNPATKDLRETPSSQQPTDEAVADGGPGEASEKLPKAMLSWLESTLSLDETRSSAPPLAP